MSFNEMNIDQRRIFIDTLQLYESYINLLHKSRSYKGGMFWKKAKGREYLFKTYDRYGNGKSLGLRSAETEKILDDFQRNKKNIKERYLLIKERLKEQARFCKAAKIQRVPRIITGILRLLDQEKLLGRNVVVIGTNAIYAYEAAAGVFFESHFMATRDMDILWDIRPKLTLAVDNTMNQEGLIGLLRRSDKSFELSCTDSFRAINKEGFMVDLIKAEPRPIFKQEPTQMGNSYDLKAVEIKNLQWLLSSPKFSHIVIGDDGYPASIAVPDPRAFALHKLWISKQDDREPIKKKRDFAQAVAVAKLIIQYLPQYSFDSAELRMFPKDLLLSAQNAIIDSDVPVGL
ncbi:MAG: nucleotidyltransferase domain-containing protein [Desulfobacterales bacterium]|nr:nucleotidyltransferase domain-containing protein [Desulfobacterales bacterium]